VIIEDSDGIHAIGIGEPSGAAGGDARETPADVVAASQLGLFGDEQAQQGTTNVAEADDCQVVRRDGFLQELISRQTKFRLWRERPPMMR
jgi:hypothetical protein